MITPNLDCILSPQKSAFIITVTTVDTAGENFPIISTEEKFGIFASRGFLIDVTAKGCSRNWVVSHVILSSQELVFEMKIYVESKNCRNNDITTMIATPTEWIHRISCCFDYSLITFSLLLSFLIQSFPLLSFLNFF